MIPEIGSRWHYKSREYEVTHVEPLVLSQDPTSGEWRPTVYYRWVDDSEATRRFARTDSEFIRKFDRVA